MAFCGGGGSRGQRDRVPRLAVALTAATIGDVLTPGTVLGNLRIDHPHRPQRWARCIGEQVSLRRPVAIKHIAPHLVTDEQALSRFEREARCSRAVHANVVGIYDFAAYQDERGEVHHLLVMELVDGGSLLNRLVTREQPLAWREATSVVMQVADGLAVAHQRDIVHRDIKPENILVGSRWRRVGRF